jgi:hypothetical protein
MFFRTFKVLIPPRLASNLSSQQQTQCLKPLERVILELFPFPVRLLFHTSQVLLVLISTCYLGASGQNTATSTSGTFSFAPPKPAKAGPSPFGGGTSTFGGSGNAKGATLAAGASDTNVFGSTTPTTGSAFSGGSLFGQSTASGSLFASTYKTLSQFVPSNNKYRCHFTTRDDRHV